MRYLTKERVVQLNKSTVAVHGGNFNPTFEQKRHF